MSHGTPLDLGRGARGAARAALTAAAVLLAAAVLAAVFMLYLQPEFLRTLADQVWACF